MACSERTYNGRYNEVPITDRLQFLKLNNNQIDDYESSKEYKDIFSVSKIENYHLCYIHPECVTINNSKYDTYIWYRYVNHRWAEDEAGTSLRKNISVTLRNIYHKKGMKMLAQNSSMPCDDDKTKIIKKKD